MSTERDSIRDLLPSHRRLLSRHRGRIAQLVSLTTVDRSQLGAIVASPTGEFGAVAAEVGVEFLNADPDDGYVVVVVLTVDGLLDIVRDAVGPEMAGPILGRPLLTMPIVIVDADDEPALALLAINELLVGPS